MDEKLTLEEVAALSHVLDALPDNPLAQGMLFDLMNRATMYDTLPLRYGLIKTAHNMRAISDVLLRELGEG